MRIVAALGGNALLARGEPLEAEVQAANIASAAVPLAALAMDHNLVVTHGNGPQVGLLALQGEAYAEVRSYPLDILDAQTQGMIGYLIEQALRNELPDRSIATLLTQIVVAHDDPAFDAPSKPIGPVFTAEEAERAAADRGWTVKADGAWWRRVVPSPEPLEILELSTIKTLVDLGTIVVCAGGGGIPIVRRDGLMQGVEAVIDKDLSTALLAQEIEADMLMMLTDVPAIALGLGTAEERWVRSISVDDLRALNLPAGSMGPKAEAAARFVESTPGSAAIGSLKDAAGIVAGTAGTQILSDGPLELYGSPRLRSA